MVSEAGGRPSSTLRIPLADGSRLVVRPIRRRDLPPIRRLHEALSPEARYLRFFTPTLPGDGYFERLVAVRDRGGVGLVAEDPDGAIVAVVDVEPLADGNGELALVVAEDWRGWLGPYLVELASRAAARLGMPNLEVQELTSNGAMRAITRSRGEAFMAGSDWHEVRVVVGTSGAAPSWSPGDRPRVLVEQHGVAFDAVAGLRAAGFDVLACAGRTVHAPWCPLLEGRRCPLAEGADTVVVAMPPGPDRSRLVAAHRERTDRVVVLTPGRQPVTSERLVEAVGAWVHGPAAGS